ncbi:MAG: fatty acyl-AMP ligase [Microcystis wesenbergii Mw_QC_B_20070930_S4D]|jgi:acyl-CoA synthetase (AMP-forming)/AMP-acid ligase II|nr:MAG: fatty acyl-AMP ligase [Microcystis wesenbergii Mw_QC_B_20070930_S4D]
MTTYQFETLGDILWYRAQNQPNQIAYVFLSDGETQEIKITYQELYRYAQKIAAKLKSLEVSNERALLVYPSGLEFIAAFFGCLYAGVVAVPVNLPRRNQKMSRLIAIAADSQSAIALTTASLLTSIKERFSQTPELADLVCLGNDLTFADLTNDCPQPIFTPNTLAFLQYTSGSTGTPKGVMVSHSNLLYNQEMIKQAFEHNEETVVVGWLPLFHDMGLIGNVLQPLYLGRQCILISPDAFLAKPIRWLKAISRYQATTSGGPDFAYDFCSRMISPEQLGDLDLSSWEVAFNGSETIRAKTIEEFSAKFKSCGFRKQAFYPCYGMAEATLLVSGVKKSQPPMVYSVKKAFLEQNGVVLATNSDPDYDIKKIVSCGQTWLDGKIKIVNPKTLTECSPREVGEIWVSSSSVTQGYWNRQQQTEETFQAYLYDTGKGPFLRTGDLGFLSDGELFVTGRLKEVIIIRGANHYPQDLEMSVQNSHPSLRQGCGAAFTIDFKGEERLVIVQEVERSYLRKLDFKEVVSKICRTIQQEHILGVYAVVLLKTGSIPITSSGKIQRSHCRDAFLSGNLNSIYDWSQNS